MDFKGFVGGCIGGKRRGRDILNPSRQTDKHGGVERIHMITYDDIYFTQEC